MKTDIYGEILSPFFPDSVENHDEAPLSVAARLGLFRLAGLSAAKRGIRS